MVANQRLLQDEVEANWNVPLRAGGCVRNMQKTAERRRFAGVVAAVALAAIAGACSTPSKSAQSTETSAASTLGNFVSDVASDVRDTTDTVLARLGVARTEDADAAKAVPDPAKSAPDTPPMPKRTPLRNRAAVAVPAKLDPQPPDTSSLPVEVEAPAPIVPAPVEPPDTVDPTVVYSEADLDVEPPRRRSSDLPGWVPPVGLDVERIEVVVSHDGGVERVKMVSTPRLIDAMALSAAKMWKFDPALKDGAPVRYRLVLNSARTPYRQRQSAAE
jgi:outer membrane biosynthesis protein TonB